MNAPYITIYDDTYDSRRFTEAQEEIFEVQNEDGQWTTPNDVPDEMVFQSMHQDDEYMWDEFRWAMEKLLNETPCLIVGTCGRWDGNYDAGSFIRTFSDLRRGLSHLDELKIYETNGHLYIEGYHHDGRDFYEVKRLTTKGRQIAESNDYAHDGKLHRMMMNSNLFTGLPRLAERIYGAAV